MIIDELDQTFPKGTMLSLDAIYDIQGLFPADAYEQGEWCNGKFVLDDSGEVIRMLRTIRIEYKVSCRPF